MNFEELKSIVSKVFTEEKKLELEMKKSEIPSWDSIGHLNLILEIEEELGISFTKEEIEHIDSFKVLLNVINSK